MSLARLFVLSVVVMAVAAACSSSAPQAAVTTTTLAASTTEATTAPAAAATTSSSPTAGPTMYFPTPTAAITYLVGAWSQNDRVSASKVANATAVSNLFTQSEHGFALYGCDTGQFTTSNCNYRDRATDGYAQIEAEKLPKGWIVLNVNMSTDG